MNFDWQKLRDVASSEVEEVLNDLPETLRERIQELPITFERKPSEDVQAEGIEEDALGLFTGTEYAEDGHAPMPAQIILFLENILDQAEGDENAFRGEIRTTFLHEVGHFLGLDEDDLIERGLD